MLQKPWSPLHPKLTPSVHRPLIKYQSLRSILYMIYICTCTCRPLCQDSIPCCKGNKFSESSSHCWLLWVLSISQLIWQQYWTFLVRSVQGFATQQPLMSSSLCFHGCLPPWKGSWILKALCRWRLIWKPKEISLKQEEEREWIDDELGRQVKEVMDI